MISGISLQHGLHVSELQKLPLLDSLLPQYADTDAASFVDSMKGLASLTRLRHLVFNLSSPDVPMAALLPLTSLTALTCLSFFYGDDPAIQMLYNYPQVKLNIIALLLPCPMFQILCMAFQTSVTAARTATQPPGPLSYHNNQRRAVTCSIATYAGNGLACFLHAKLAPCWRLTVPGFLLCASGRLRSDRVAATTGALCCRT
jgi:hypothetical protein